MISHCELILYETLLGQFLSRCNSPLMTHSSCCHHSTHTPLENSMICYAAQYECASNQSLPRCTSLSRRIQMLWTWCSLICQISSLLLISRSSHPTLMHQSHESSRHISLQYWIPIWYCAWTKAHSTCSCHSYTSWSLHVLLLYSMTDTTLPMISKNCIALLYCHFHELLLFPCSLNLSLTIAPAAHIWYCNYINCIKF